jgi:hypothetical protein
MATVPATFYPETVTTRADRLAWVESQMERRARDWYEFLPRTRDDCRARRGNGPKNFFWFFG